MKKQRGHMDLSFLTVIGAAIGLALVGAGGWLLWVCGPAAVRYFLR